MLVLFNEDKCTSILNTRKVRRILNKEPKLSERSSIEVKYDVVNCKAVIKLHGKYHL